MDSEKRHASMERWKRRCKPMPLAHAQLALEHTFSADEWQRICRGVVPLQMEDKWFIFVEGDMVHFHRSWTGYCIYEMQGSPLPKGVAVQRVTVNRDPDQYPCVEDEYDLALLDFLISNFLLGQRKPFPLPRGSTPAEKRGSGVAQHHIAGTGYPEVSLQEEKNKAE